MIESIRFKCFRHSPYSPDNGPIDIRVFMLDKSHLSSWKFGNRPFFDIFVTETMKIVSTSDGLFYIEKGSKQVNKYLPVD